MKGRQIARELALLGLSQVSKKPAKLTEQELTDLVLAAVRTLTSEVEDILETAASELKRSESRLLDSETRTEDVQVARSMLSEAIALTQTAINRLGAAVSLPEFVQLANQKEVRAFAIELLIAVNTHAANIDSLLDRALVDWQLKRLARIDRDLLRIAVAEILYVGTPERVAINEAVEIAKRYSEEDGHRFINGVLRRVVDLLRSSSETSSETVPNG